MYFDNAATTKPFEDIINNIPEILNSYYANPNSVHSLGQKVRNKIEKVRIEIASYLNTEPEKIIFTSGATESSNAVLKSFLFSDTKKDEILISPIEHKSVLIPAKFLAKKGFKLKFLSVDKNGLIDLDDLKQKISHKTAIVCVIHGNNETGVLQNIKEISKICKEKGVLFFSDIVQSFIKEDIPVENLDFFPVSGHKLNSLKGFGFLYAKNPDILVPLLHGGGQENGFRSGTQNCESIISFGIALKNWINSRINYINHLKNLRDIFEKLLKQKIPDIEIVSENVERVCNISNVIFPKVDAQSMLTALSSRGIYVSSGSACSSGTPTPSHVLTSYGYKEEEALRSIRFSFGIYNTIEEVEEGVEKIKEVFDLLYSFD